jgi:CHAT domain-containing protein/Flp pilus assembly protein TadD
MKKLLTIPLLIISLSLVAQDDWLSKAMAETGTIQKAKLDSIDFQFAMTVNDNTGFIDIKNKGEGFWTNAFYGMKPKSQRTPQEVARDTVEFAISYYQLRWYSIAEIYLHIGRTYIESVGLTNELSYIKCISNLGLVALMQGKNFEAEQYINYALTTSEKMLGRESAAYAANLNSHAKWLQATGKFNEAEKEFEEVHDIVLKVFGVNSMQNAIVLNNKAMLNQSMGRYPEAEKLIREAITVQGASSGKKKADTKSFEARKFLTNLAFTYQLSGNLAEAEKSFLQIKDIFEKKYLVGGQTNNPDYANLLNQIALLYIQMNKMDQVEPLLQKSATIYKKRFTEENASFAKVQHDLGNFYRLQGRYTEAETTLQKALGIRQRVLGENHPEYVKTLEYLGILYWKKGDAAMAYQHLSSAANKSLEFINNYFPPMSEAEKTKYWDVLQPRFQRFYNFAVDTYSQNPAVLTEVFNFQIATKALLLNSTNKIKSAILNSGDQALIRDYTEWVSKKESLAKYYALSKEELAQQKIDLNALEKSANDMERSLSQRSGDFAKGFESEKVDILKISSLLTDSEALLEIIRVRSFDKDFTDESRYLALVLLKGSAQPAVALLDNGIQLETRYAKFYKNAIQQKMNDEFSYAQYWQRIEPLLAGKKVLYLSPDGVFNQINVNTLKKAEGQYVVNQFDVVVIGNAKDVIPIKQKKQTVTRKEAFVLGFPDYGGTAVALPGTKVEIEAIDKILTTSGYKVTLRQQKEASEATLKRVKSPALMHIATHGYFLADADLSKGGDAMGVDAENAKNNPLLRSGLILAGAPKQENTTQDFQSNDNGVLTAYEAMNLSLDGTDLIILSACETGLGDVRAGEGVYGLQRAFLVAGANALIMSLWKVDDDATQQLMTNFYTNWTKLGNKQKAFKQAQLQLMTKYNEPYYWGAFVMMGM